MSITESSILDVIQEALTRNPVRPDGAFRILELKARLSNKGMPMSDARLRLAVAELRRRGQVEVVKITYKSEVNDRLTTVDGYRFVNGKKK